MNGYDGIAELERLRRLELSRRMHSGRDMPGDFSPADRVRGLFGYGVTSEQAERPYRELGIMDMPIFSLGPLEMRLGDIVPGVSTIGTFASIARPRESLMDWAMIPSELASMVIPGRFRPPDKLGWTAPKDYTMEDLRAARPQSSLGTIGAQIPQQRILTQTPGTQTGRRISVAQPALRYLPEDVDIHSTPQYNVGIKEMKADPSRFAKAMELVEQYPSLPMLSRAKTPEGISRIAKQHMRENLNFLLSHADPAFLERSRNWYKGANAFANDLANSYSIPVETSAAVLARLSPTYDWLQNVELADRIIDIWKNKQNEVWTSDMDDVAKERGWNQKQIEEIRGRSLSELDNYEDRAKWVRAYDEAYYPSVYREMTPEGKFSDLARQKSGAPKKLSWQTDSNVIGALKILDDQTIEGISKNMGGGHKIRSFYNNIIDPWHPISYTADTHQMAASLLTPYSSSNVPENAPVAHGFGNQAGKGLPSPPTIPQTGVGGTYGLYADVGRAVAKDFGFGIASEVQSPSWELMRELAPGRRKAELVPDVERIWGQVGRRYPAARAREDILEYLGGIRHPLWYTQKW